MIEDRKAFPNASENDPIHISLSGITYPDRTYRIKRKKAKVSVLEYVLNGGGYIETDDDIVRVTKDQITFYLQKYHIVITRIAILHIKKFL